MVKGSKHSEETKKKMSDALRDECHPNYGKHHSDETKKKMSVAHKGKHLSDEIKKKISENHADVSGKNNPNYGLTGEKHPFYGISRPEISEKMKGKNNPNWKGGLTSLHISIRSSLPIQIWRNQVFKRDRYQCQLCGGKDLQAHHIEPFHKILEDNNIDTFEKAVNCKELFNTDNGITLCRSCHGLISPNGNKYEQFKNIFYTTIAVKKMKMSKRI